MLLLQGAADLTIWKTTFLSDAVKRIPRLFAPTGWLLVLGVNGAARADFSGTEYIDEVPIVLCASRLSQSLAHAFAAVTIIDRDVIRALALPILLICFVWPCMNVPILVGHSPEFVGDYAEFRQQFQFNRGVFEVYA